MLDELSKYKVLRPIFGNIDYDESMPIIKKEDFENVNWNKVNIVNYKSSKNLKNPENTVVVMFNYDNVLDTIWNNPLSNVARFQNCLAVATPDFSIYESMNKYDIEHGIYKSRWLGATWQSLGIRVIPTISWGNENTFYIAFKGIEKHSIVIISTIGCQNNKEVFLKGYDAMMKAIEPEIVIVYGKMIKGIYGNVIPFDYTDAFSKNKYYEQLSVDEFDRILSIEKEVNQNGK